MKKFLCIILMLFVMLMLCSCKEVEKSQETVTTFFTALQNNDQNTAKSCIVEKNDENAENESGSETETETAENAVIDNSDAYNRWDFDEHIARAFTKITYNITAAEQDENDKNRVNVTVDVTSVDMTTIFSEALSEAINASFANIFAVSEDTTIDVSAVANDYFINSLEKEDLQFTTKTVVIPVVKTEDGMKIDTNEELGDAVTGGLFSYISGLSQNAN